MIFLRRKTDEEYFQSKFKSSSKTLDEILNCQISSSKKTGLGYDNGKNIEQSSFINKEGNKISYVDALMRPVVKEYSQKISLPQNKSRINNVTNRHQQLFLGNCYTCNNFGHIARNC